MSVEANHRVRQVRRRKSVASTDALFQMISDAPMQEGTPSLLFPLQGFMRFSRQLGNTSSGALGVVSHDIVYRGWGERDEGLARYGARY